MSQKILNCSDPRKVKFFGRKVKNFDPRKWEENRETIVTQGCLLKFQQNPKIKEVLLMTQQKIIVEAYDKIWGIGLTEDRARKIDPKEWPGTNLLGKCLMNVRNQVNLE
jgi:ribA/ribD-fused uncharacterized protein